MPQNAGAHPRKLAWQRQLNAAKCFVLALGLAIAPCLAPSFPKLKIPVIVYPICWSLAAYSALAGVKLWQRSRHAIQGATGEEQVAKVLASLAQQGWTIEYGVLMPGLGDVDVVLRSPRGKAFVIEVKSHKGGVEYSPERGLYRRYGKKTFQFEKDFIQQMTRQIHAVKNARQLSYVIAILVFTQAKIEFDERKQRGIYIVELHRLLKLLQALEKGQLRESCSVEKL